jgi:hypothetical protein
MSSPEQVVDGVHGTAEEIAALQQMLGAIAAVPGIMLDGSAGLAAIKNTLGYPGAEPWSVKYGPDHPTPGAYRDLDVLSAADEFYNLQEELRNKAHMLDPFVDLVRWIPGAPPTLRDHFPRFPLHPSIYAPRMRHLADVSIPTLSLGALVELSLARGYPPPGLEHRRATQLEIRQVAVWARWRFPEEFPPLRHRLPIKAFRLLRFAENQIKKPKGLEDEEES